MSQDSSPPTPLATWNPARGVWETNQQAICGHLEPYSQTWPKWGSMRTGEVFALPMPAPLTGGSASSSSQLLGTPNAHPRTHSPRDVDHGIQLANQVMALLPTPQAHDSHSPKTPEQVAAMRERTGAGVRNLNEEVITLLPMPVADNSRGLPPESTDYQSLANVAATLTD